MNLYYWNVRKNFGDGLAPLLVKRFTGIDAIYSSPERAELVVCGSIMEHLPEDWSGVIAGIGKLHEKTRMKLPYARVLALRGPLSAKGISGDYVLADPGLLADELVKPEERIYNLGIVPHWSDSSLEHNPLFTKYNPHIIRVGDNPLRVISEIGKCKKIVSSSLHGIILADAFGIPRRIELAPRMISHPHQEGGIFKWQDYSMSIEMKLEIGVTQEANKNKIVEKQHELFDVFQEIKRILS